MGWERAPLPSQGPSATCALTPLWLNPGPLQPGRKMSPGQKAEGQPSAAPSPRASVGLCSGAMAACPGGHRRVRTGLCRPSGRRQRGGREGRRCWEGDRETVTHCGWGGLAGVASARSPAHPSTCRAARQAGAAAAPSLPVSGVIQPNCAAAARPGQASSGQRKPSQPSRPPGKLSRGWPRTLGCLQGSAPQRPGSLVA